MLLKRKFHDESFMCSICLNEICFFFEGTAVGLVKNLALMAYISKGTKDMPIIELLEEFGMENLGIIIIEIPKSMQLKQIINLLHICASI